MLFNDQLDASQGAAVETPIVGQADIRKQPELSFVFAGSDVDMHWLAWVPLVGEEQELESLEP